MEVSGERSSCDTFATKPERRSSCFLSSSAIALKLIASWPISSLDFTSAFLVKSPRAMWRAIAFICASGREIRVDISDISTTPRTIATSAETKMCPYIVPIASFIVCIFVSMKTAPTGTLF